MFVQQRTPHLRHRVFAFHSDGSKSIPVGIDQSVSLQHVLDRLLFVDDLGKLIPFVAALGLLDLAKAAVEIDAVKGLPCALSLQDGDLLKR